MRCWIPFVVLSGILMPCWTTAQQSSPSPLAGGQPGPADVLELALEKHLYFVLPSVLEHAPGIKPEQTSYFQGMLALHEGRSEDARKLLTDAVNTHDSVLTSAQKIMALEALGDSARYTFHLRRRRAAPSRATKDCSVNPCSVCFRATRLTCGRCDSSCSPELVQG